MVKYIGGGDRLGDGCVVRAKFIQDLEVLILCG